MTNTSGLIKDRNWFGDLESVFTKSPHCSPNTIPITRFDEILTYLYTSIRKGLIGEGFEVILDVKDDNDMIILDDIHKALETSGLLETSLTFFIGLWAREWVTRSNELWPSPQKNIFITWIGEEFTPEIIDSLYPACTAFNIDHQLLSIRLMQKVRSLPVKLFAWTCNKPKSIALAKALEVDSILTDDPTSV